MSRKTLCEQNERYIFCNWNRRAPAFCPRIYTHIHTQLTLVVEMNRCDINKPTENVQHKNERVRQKWFRCTFGICCELSIHRFRVHTFHKMKSHIYSNILIYAYKRRSYFAHIGSNEISYQFQAAMFIIMQLGVHMYLVS